VKEFKIEKYQWAIDHVELKFSTIDNLFALHEVSTLRDYNVFHAFECFLFYGFYVQSWSRFMEFNVVN
jgi:hypothetical protein